MNTQQFNLIVLEASSTNFPHKSLSLSLSTLTTYVNNICMKTEYFVLWNITFLINYEQSKSWPHLQNLIKTHITASTGHEIISKPLHIDSYQHSLYVREKKLAGKLNYFYNPINTSVMASDVISSLFTHIDLENKNHVEEILNRWSCLYSNDID